MFHVWIKTIAYVITYLQTGSCGFNGMAVTWKKG